LNLFASDADWLESALRIAFIGLVINPFAISWSSRIIASKLSLAAERWTILQGFSIYFESQTAMTYNLEIESHLIEAGILAKPGGAIPFNDPDPE
jgi:hypothetical protein